MSMLAAVELDRLRAAWSRLNARFAGKRPDAFDGDPLYVVKITDVPPAWSPPT